MKILTLPLPMNGCTWYRIKQPFGEMDKLGLAETALIFEKDTRVFEENAREFLDVSDVIVWRQGHLENIGFILKNIDMSKKLLVYDADDNDFACQWDQENYRHYGTEDVWYDGKLIWVDKDSDVGKESPPNIQYDRTNNTKRLELLKDMVRKSDMVVVTTPTLKRLYEGMNNTVNVVPNAIDFTVYKTIKIKHEGFRIGWAGGCSHYSDFFDSAPVIIDFVNAHPDVKLVLAGDPPKELFVSLPEDKIERHPWVIADAHAYRLMTLGLDLAVIPLKKTDFSVCKSPLKYLEMSALKVPCVVSRETPYKEVVTDMVDGFLYSNPTELRRCLERAYADPLQRMTVAKRANSKVKKEYDLRDWATKYQILLEDRLKEKLNGLTNPKE